MTPMKIPRETTGKILSGGGREPFVKVLDDDEGAGGFFILTSMTESFAPCFDDWVESEADLVSYFQGLVVEWRRADRQ